jgi:hypothetical protein
MGQDKTRRQMSKKLDNFFSDKLREHSVAPSPRAWEKVESNLTKKNNSAIVLRVAAAIVLLAAITIIIADQSGEGQTKSTTPQLARQKPVEVAPEIKTKVEPPASTKQLEVEAAQTAPRHSIKTTEKEGNEIKSKSEATNDGLLVVMETTTVEEAEVVPPGLSSGESQSTKTKRIVIVYNLPTINKSTPPATEEKKSGLQKVMDVAMDMRAAENPLGELREAKDELFAREFKKDKNKTN